MAFRFSIIVPTYNRRDIVIEAVASIAATRRPFPCELVVVVDGSTDGTVEALRDLDPGLPLTVVEQENRGSAAARNAGAEVATGELLLFLDDDMTVDPGVLIAHESAFSAGADVVVGNIRLDVRSPHTLLTRGVQRWADKRRIRLEQSEGPLGIADFLTGQLSVRSEWYAKIHGFDGALTRDGSFGGEDTDFVYRLLQAGARLRFTAGAISYQRYVVTAEQNVRQWNQAGRADTMLARKHPGLGASLWRGHGGGTVGGRVVRAAAGLPDGMLSGFSGRVIRRVDRGRMDLPTELLYAGVRDIAYWRGVRESGGLGPVADTGVRILAYHAVEGVADPAIGRYCVTPELFEQQITAVVGAGHTVISADDLLAHLDGRPLPPRSVLLTFDDAYRSLLTGARPILARYGLTGAVFVVTDQIGGHNAWDAVRGATRLPLLTADELRLFRDEGWEIGSHSRRHAHLTTLRGADLADDLRHSRAVLARLGLGEARLLAYPHGEHDRRVCAHTRAAGYRAALALTTGAVVPDAGARYAIPRIEVLRDTTAEDLLGMLSSPHRHTTAGLLRRELRGAVSAGASYVPRLTGRRHGASSPAATADHSEGVRG